MPETYYIVPKEKHDALVKKAYTEGAIVAVNPSATEPAPAKGKQADVAAPASGERPTLKRPSP